MHIPSPKPYEERSENAIPWHTTLLGNYMQHNYWLYAIIDRVMLANPQISSIVEIGTGSGCVSTIFGLWGIHRKIPVLTIDNVERHHSDVLNALGVQYLQVDENGDEAQSAILDCVHNLPTWIYCDGGCKSKEFKKFAPLIPKGSIISAHDLGMEFRHDIDAINLCNEGVVEPFHPEWWMEFNIQLAIYKKL